MGLPGGAALTALTPAVRAQVVVKHDTGMGESYMDGDYECDSWGGFLAVAVANANSIEAGRGLLGVFNWLGDRLLYLAHQRRPNTIQGSRKNIEEHYDAGGLLPAACCQLPAASACLLPAASAACCQLPLPAACCLCCLCLPTCGRRAWPAAAPSGCSAAVLVTQLLSAPPANPLMPPANPMRALRRPSCRRPPKQSGATCNLVPRTYPCP
jgi:hypothetical protein